MKKLFLMLHAVTAGPVLLAAFIFGWFFWSAYAGFQRAKDLQLWLTR